MNRRQKHEARKIERYLSSMQHLDKDAVIQTFNLTKIYSITEGIEVHALNDVNISIKRGEFVSIMGPSGSGKTTLLNMIGALDIPTKGSVYINGTNIAHMDENERTHLRLREIGFIFQFYNLVPVLTVAENVELPLIFAGKVKVGREKAVSEVLELVKLDQKSDYLPSELSGGEKQRVAIARALANSPSILIADEPTGELDSQQGIEIITLMRELNKDLDQTILMVTHDPAVGALAERMIRMRDGKTFRILNSF